MGSVPRVLFSDIDGTLVHYPKHFEEYAVVETLDEERKSATLRYLETGERIECVVLSSLTGGQAFLSRRTLELVRQIRERGVLFVMITGARSSTYMQRRAQLPSADYEFFENGGRLIARGTLDAEWTRSFSAQIGSDVLSEPVPDTFPPPEKRDGELWELFRELKAEQGWHIDTKDYFADFRVDLKKSSIADAVMGGKTCDAEAQLAAKVAARPGLASSMNLGKADVYPAKSGKRNAAAEILRRENISAAESAAMFDDDNDIELGELCAHAFLPSVTHPSVLAAVERNPHWQLMSSKGVKGTEEALEKILAMLTPATSAAPAVKSEVKIPALV
uniref:Trehalose-phosphatase n=1 Tax=Erythrolobus australicus TaxID=1077150 RepID=A0A7S1XIB5_9RHOD|mmetsp:Transcript_2682/g.7317  ORF Transcript_2682/g.7317 Transcript_2682/m.7317 type:complete len:333 (+) Transcript_2682:279-1277(+)